MQILVIDNFDSFTYNLVDYFHQLGGVCTVVRNTVPIDDIPQQHWDGIVLSPGPSTPAKAGFLLDYVAYFFDKIPILGICLGHQAIGVFGGARLEKSIRPMHGKISTIELKALDPLVKGIPTSFDVVRYHSLVLNCLPIHFKVLATAPEDEVMLIRWMDKMVWGIQYHPEAVLTTFGKKILQNWMDEIKRVQY